MPTQQDFLDYELAAILDGQPLEEPDTDRMPIEVDNRPVTQPQLDLR
jgi:hypothetical protein